MWEVTTVAAGASVQELLWDSAAWGVSRGRKPASRSKGAMDMSGSHGCVWTCVITCAPAGSRTVPFHASPSTWFEGRCGSEV